MAQQYFECPNCGSRDLLTYRAADVGGDNWPPICPTPECFEVRMVAAPRPGDFTMDAKSDGGTNRSFQKFSVQRQVMTKAGLTHQVEEIDSLHKLRQVERDSEQRYRNGEGEPLRFRMWNQDRSQQGVNSFGTQGQIGSRTYADGAAPAAKNPKITTTRHGEKKPRVKTARGGGVTALRG